MRTGIKSGAMTGKEKIATALTVLLYYGLLPFAAYCQFWFSWLFGLIIHFSEPLFYALFAGLPVLLLIVPVVVRRVRNIRFYKAILKSLIAVAVCVALVITVHVGIVFGMKRFTKEKWAKYECLRFLMIEDMEARYDFTGMTRAEVDGILGESFAPPDGPADCYLIDTRGFFKPTYYRMDFDENGRVINTRTVSY